MTAYVGRRVLQVVPTMFLIVTIIFFLVYVLGDPVSVMAGDNATPEMIASMREALGLNRPLHEQYFLYLTNALQGDFGTSYQYNQPAMPIVLERLPATLTLAVASIILTVVIAIPMGVWAAVRRGSRLDALISGVSVLAKAMPNFWLGIMLILLFAVILRWLPVSGTGSWWHLLLPAVALGTGTAAEVTRLVRSSMVEILGHDYVRTARGKGLHETVVVYKHALLNAFVPVLSITLLQFSGLIGGALVTEAVFAWPGLGQLLVNAVTQRDMALVQAAVFVIALMVLALSLVADVLFKAVDRRISLG